MHDPREQVLFETYAQQPRPARVDPGLVGLREKYVSENNTINNMRTNQLPLIVSWGNEVFNLHLLELSGAEHKIPRSDLVAESLAHLRDTKWHL
jgi:hypothetical protein